MKNFGNTGDPPCKGIVEGPPCKGVMSEPPLKGVMDIPHPFGEMGGGSLRGWIDQTGFIR